MDVTYLMAALLFCGLFAAFIAAGKNRSKAAWFFIGLVPVVGVVAALLVKPAKEGSSRSSGAAGTDTGTKKLKRASRCCGHFIPDCRGCDYFQTSLFHRTAESKKAGYCNYYNRILYSDKNKETVGQIIGSAADYSSETDRENVDGADPNRLNSQMTQKAKGNQ